MYSIEALPNGTCLDVFSYGIGELRYFEDRFVPSIARKFKETLHV